MFKTPQLRASIFAILAIASLNLPLTSASADADSTQTDNTKFAAEQSELLVYSAADVNSRSWIASRSGRPPIPAASTYKYLKPRTSYGSSKRELRSLIAATDKEFYVFPTFDLAYASVRSADDISALPNVEPSSLFVDGKTTWNNKLKYAMIRLFLGTPTVDRSAELAILDAVKATKDPLLLTNEGKLKEAFTPETETVWNIELLLNYPSNSKAFYPLGQTLQVDLSRPFMLSELDYTIDNAQLVNGQPLAKIIPNAKPRDFVLRASVGFTARFYYTDYKISLKSLGTVVTKILNRVIATPFTSETVLSIPVGGKVGQEFNFVQSTVTSTYGQIEYPVGKTPPESIVKMFLEEEFRQISRDVSSLPGTQMLSLVLKNGARITTPISEVSKVVDEMSTYSKEQVYKMYKEHSQSTNYKKIGGSAYFDMIGLWGGGAEFDYQKYDSNSKEWQSVYDEFKENLTSVKKAAEGKWPGVVSMDLKSMHQAAQSGKFEKSFEAKGFVETDVVYPILLDIPSDGDFYDEQTIRWRSACDTSLIAYKSRFDNFRGKFLRSDSSSSYEWSDFVGKYYVAPLGMGIVRQGYFKGTTKPAFTIYFMTTEYFISSFEDAKKVYLEVRDYVTPAFDSQWVIKEKTGSGTVPLYTTIERSDGTGLSTLIRVNKIERENDVPLWDVDILWQ